MSQTIRLTPLNLSPLQSSPVPLVLAEGDDGGHRAPGRSQLRQRAFRGVPGTANAEYSCFTGALGTSEATEEHIVAI